MLAALEQRPTRGGPPRADAGVARPARRAASTPTCARPAAGAPSGSPRRWLVGCDGAAQRGADATSGSRSKGRTAPAALDRRRRARRPPAAPGAAPALRRPRRAADGHAADVARPPPLGVDAAPGRGRRPAPRPGRRPARGRRSGSTASTPRSSARSSTRSTRAWPRRWRRGRRAARRRRGAPDAAVRRPGVLVAARATRPTSRGSSPPSSRGAPERLLDTYEQERRPHVAGDAAPGRRHRRLRPGDDAARGSRARDAFLNAIDGTPVAADAGRERQAAARPTAPARSPQRPARLPWRRTVGSLFPQTDRLDDRLGPGWAAVAVDDRPPRRCGRTACGSSTRAPTSAWLRAARR